VTRRRLLAAAYAGYLLSVAYLVWTPDPSAPGGAVEAVTELLGRIGLPVGPAGVEFGLNVVMFVPLSLLGAFLLDRWGTYDWFLIGLAATVLIEMVQGMFLPTRTSSSLDVIANTIGSMVGLAAAHGVREADRRRRADRMAP
jgi:hypothetical protein